MRATGQLGRVFGKVTLMLVSGVSNGKTKIGLVSSGGNPIDLLGSGMPTPLSGSGDAE